MGIAVGDSDDDALPDIMITHFWGEHDTLWRARREAAGTLLPGPDQRGGPAVNMQVLTGWGTCFADFDLDGRLDLVATNGHIRRERALRIPMRTRRSSGARRRRPVRQRHRRGRRLFPVLAHRPRPGLRRPRRRRRPRPGHRPPPRAERRPLERDPARGNWLIVKLRGLRADRDAIGAD